MDPLTLAATAVSMIAAYFARVGDSAAEKIGADLAGSLGERLGQLYERIKTKVSGDRFAEPTLERLEQQPDSGLRQAALAEILAELVTTDASFADDLSRLISASRAASDATLTQIADAGAVALRGTVNMRGMYVAGRDMTINRPAGEQPGRKP